MALCANAPSDILYQPRTVRTTVATIQTTPTFSLSGAPLPVQIKGISGLSEKVRKDAATKDTSNWDTYFAADNYIDKNLLTNNILPGDVNTTLRFKNETYTLLFACIHKKIWSSAKDKNVQVSLLFRAQSNNFFHICIPIVNLSDNANENPFLRSWLTSSPVTPSGLTFNDVLNFRGNENAVSFSLLEFCMNYNRTSTAPYMTKTNVYTFCVFDTPLYVSTSTYTQCTWLNTSDKEVFDDIFNLFLRNEIYYFVTTAVRDPYLTGTEKHFGDDVVTQNSITPAFFTVATISLSGTIYTSDQLKNNVRGLSNVKCYPIDLASQVDENGNIYIDRTTNKPTDTNEVLKYLKSSGEPSKSNIIDVISKDLGASNVTRNKTIMLIIKIFIGLVLLYIVIMIVLYLLKPTKVEGNLPYLAGAAGVLNATGARQAVEDLTGKGDIGVGALARGVASPNNANSHSKGSAGNSKNADKSENSKKAEDAAKKVISAPILAAIGASAAAAGAAAKRRSPNYSSSARCGANAATM
jgi:hypothetical protein